MVQVMNEVQQAKGNRTLGNRLASTVLVFTVPILLLAIIGMLGGGSGIGTVELALLLVIWILGLIWVWAPRRR